MDRKTGSPYKGREQYNKDPGEIEFYQPGHHSNKGVYGAHPGYQHSNAPTSHSEQKKCSGYSTPQSYGVHHSKGKPNVKDVLTGVI